MKTRATALPRTPIAQAIRAGCGLLCLFFVLVASVDARADRSPELDQRLDAWLKSELKGLVKTYKHFHANPELSLEEAETAKRVAKEFRAAGFAVSTGVGGHGVVGILKNGAGPTVLIRGDTDGLPVTENTGLSYASKVTARRDDGTTTGVMHACGHDVHTTNLIGTAQFLAATQDAWSGTLVAIAQPAEELGRGALAMIDDGLFERIPRPNYTVALHVESSMAAGDVGYTSGWSHANVDSVDITIYGRGGHGARPHTTVDPIVVSAHLVTQLQTLVSRRVDPLDPAVVTVGSIHGGHKHNVIPDQVHLQLTVRSYSDEVRNILIDGIRQMARDTCVAFQCPKAPLVATRDNYTPAVYADPGLVATAVEVFRDVLGDEHVVERKPSMGGEDFGRYARALEVPGIMFRLGTISRESVTASEQPGASPLPSLHSSLYAPLPEPTLRTGIKTMSQLVLELFEAK
ncbi:MAG: amidohydrolase [Myxococcota bacterium]|jgi:amidohydrolase